MGNGRLGQFKQLLFATPSSSHFFHARVWAPMGCNSHQKSLIHCGLSMGCGGICSTVGNLLPPWCLQGCFHFLPHSAFVAFFCPFLNMFFAEAPPPCLQGSAMPYSGLVGVGRNQLCPARAPGCPHRDPGQHHCHTLWVL